MESIPDNQTDITRLPIAPGGLQDAPGKFQPIDSGPLYPANLPGRL